MAGAERVFEVIDRVPELTDAPNAQPLLHVEGDVVLDDVSFAYEKDTPVLEHVDLHAEPGQIVAKAADEPEPAGEAINGDISDTDNE